MQRGDPVGGEAARAVPGPLGAHPPPQLDALGDAVRPEVGEAAAFGDLALGQRVQVLPGGVVGVPLPSPGYGLQRGDPLGGEPVGGGGEVDEGSDVELD